MELAKTLCDSLREVLLDGKWITGTNIKQEIVALDWQIATTKIDSLNSIADLTFHLDYYLAGVLQVFQDGELEIRDKYSFDYKAPESQLEWEQLTTKFCTDAENFVRVVEGMTNEELEKTFVKEEYGTYFRNISALSEHCYYHLGQIMLIKKLIQQRMN